MSLRINQNVTSLATYANLNATNTRNEKSIEKLSTGLRINKASDDATGLAISEKMRSQVRGLNRAKSNAQDGKSYLQTAEGGLNETQSIIQRMRDLAVQGANDTLTSNDRLEIQKEINQLKSAIDDISNSTEFNTKKLLNGSQNALFTSSSSAISGIVTGDVEVNGNYNVSMAVINGGISQMQKSQILTDKNTGELAKGNTKLEDIAQFYDDNGVFALANDQILTLTGNSKTSELSINGKMTLDELAANLRNTIVSESKLGIKNSAVEVINTASTNISDLGGYLQFTSGAIGEDGNVAIAGDQAVMDALGFSVTRQSVNNQVQVRIEDGSGNVRTIDTDTNRATGLIDGMDISFDSTAAQIAGKGGIVDGIKFTTTNYLDFTFNIPNIAINVGIQFASGSYSLEGIAEIINATAKDSSPNNIDTGFEASVVDGQIRLAYNPTDGNSSTEIEITSGGNQILGFLEGTYSGFVDGDKNLDKCVQGISLLDKNQIATTSATMQTINISDGTGTGATINVGYTRSVGSADLVEANQFVLSANNQLTNSNVAARVDIVNGSIAFTSTVLGKLNGNNGIANNGNITVDATDMLNDNLDFKDGTASGSGDTNYKVRVAANRPSLQIGANAGQQMSIGIIDMSTKALGIDKLDLSTSEGAQTALAKIDQALGKVSAERSKLGAYSNRLDHTMSNLENSATNLTDAESRIRDVDMAAEMIDFTSSQIMMRSGTAMLAQANVMSQSVLSLVG